MFNAAEIREQQRIDRAAGQLGLAANREYQAGVDRTSAITGAIGAIGSLAGTAATNATNLQVSQNNLAAARQGSSGANYAAQFGSMGNNFTSNPFSSSDRRLKKNINQIGKSPNGLNIYSFEYIDNKFGNGLFQGVMSDEVPTEAVIKGADGYDRVNYSLLDVEFKQI
jgi:uncharacterized protein YukE